jgi:site-specific recombinase XerD
VYGTKKKIQYRTDADADRLAESAYIKENGGFEVTVTTKKPYDSISAVKPDLQIIFEAASEDEKKAFKRYNDLLAGSEALRISKIDLSREMDAWLDNLDSPKTQKTYRWGINKFLHYCETRDIIPLMISGTESREFRNWLEADGATNPVIRTTLISCGMLFERVFESHDLHRRNPFKVKDLLPPKRRVKKLWVPNQTEVDKLLDFSEKNLVVYTALRLIIKFGMRIGAFAVMNVIENRAVTVSKAKEMVYLFEEEDIILWRNCPLNKFSTKELADRVNYLLKQAFEDKVVLHRYSVHRIRHYFAIKTLKESGGDFYKVSKDLGHSSIATTGTYLESLDKEALSGEEI